MPELTLNEWRTEGRRLFKEGLSVKDIEKRIGKHHGDFRLEPSTKQGIKFRDVTVKLRRREKEKVPDSNRALFIDDESFEKYKDSVAQDKRGIDERTKLATKESGTKYNKGHGQSAETGGPTSSRNLMLENGSRNSSHGASNPSRGGLLNTGIATSWREDAINYQDSSGLPLEYTPKDKQRIRNAPPDMVDEVTAQVDAERWKAIKENPNARPIRTNPKPQVHNPPTKQNFHGLTIDVTRPGVPKPRARTKLKLPKPTRNAVKALAAAGLAAPSVFGYAASAAETTGRAQIARETGNVMDWVQTAISATSLAADPIPVVGEFISTPADLTNVLIDQHREGGSTLNGSGRGGGTGKIKIGTNNGPRGRWGARRAQQLQITK